MRCRLVIFDMDGTILDTLTDLAEALNTALRRCSYPERTTEEIRSFIGNGVQTLVRRALPANADAEAAGRVYRAFTSYYRVHCTDHTRPYDGVLPLLRALREAGCRTAVVSNKADYGVQTLCARYFDGLFDMAVGERDGIAKKPAPDSVNAVLRALQVPAAEAVYVGDSEVDLETAANAGMDCIAVSWGFRGEASLREHGAREIAGCAEELAALLGAEEDFSGAPR